MQEILRDAAVDAVGVDLGPACLHVCGGETLKLGGDGERPVHPERAAVEVEGGIAAAAADRNG